MITALIAHPPPDNNQGPREVKASVVAHDEINPRHEMAMRSRRVPTKETIEPPGTTDNDDERELPLLVAIMLLVLVLPAVLMLVYVIITPDAFMDDITPRYDFSSWQLGASWKPTQ